ncbi:MAG: hypothetical protein ACTS73_06965 [Arsenophonus sp. NEOnobi-MAG3]
MVLLEKRLRLPEQATASSGNNWEYGCESYPYFCCIGFFGDGDVYSTD